MIEMTVFDVLVRTLDSNERRSLLDRIRASSEVSQSPLHPPEEPEAVINLEGEYRRMSLLRKLIILIRSLVTGKDRDQLLEQVLLRRLETLIERHAPGLVLYRRRMFGERLHDALAALRNNIQVLKQPLDLAMRRDKEDFIAFLAGIEMPEVQRLLLETSDPQRLWRDDMEMDGGALRAGLLRGCEEVLDAIPKETRRTVYYDVQALAMLTRLAMQPFGSMLACFRSTIGLEERCAGFSELSRYLGALSQVTSALELPPTPEALRALFLFFHKDSLLDASFRLDDHLAADLSNVDATLNGIRDFNEAVPLLMLVKYATGNLSFRAKNPGGGEDWFAIYKAFWRQHAARSYALFYRRKKQERLAVRAIAYLGLQRLPDLDEYRSENFDEDVVLKHPLSLAFLKGFFQQVFARILRPLKIILTNGEFYKTENRNELNDSLAYLGLIEENMTSFESRLAKEGDLGRELAAAKAERRSPAERVRRIRHVAEQADRNATYLVTECYKKLYNLTQILDGILHGKSSERYDTLANLSSIGGVGNRLLISAWSEALEQLRGALGLLQEMRDLEEAPLQG